MTTPSTSVPRSKSGAFAPSVEHADDAEPFADRDVVLCFLLPLVAAAATAAVVVGSKVDSEDWSLDERRRVEDPDGGILSESVENGK